MEFKLTMFIERQFEELEEAIKEVPEPITKKQRLNLLKLLTRIKSLIKRKKR